MSKSHTTPKHMSADGEDKFQEGLEGSGDFGSIDDWETDLGLKILKIQKVLSEPHAQANHSVHNMLQRKLSVMQASLDFLDENPKAAATVGANGGIEAVMAYIIKQAQSDAAVAETRIYSDKVKPHLAGVRLSSNLQRQSGLMGVPANIPNPQAGNGNQPAQIPNPNANARRGVGLLL